MYSLLPVFEFMFIFFLFMVALVSLIASFFDFFDEKSNLKYLLPLFFALCLFIGFYLYFDPLKEKSMTVEGNKMTIYAAQDFTNGIEIGRYVAKNNDFVHYIYAKNKGKAVAKYKLSEVTFFDAGKGDEPYIQFYNKESTLTFFGFKVAEETRKDIRADFYVPVNTLEEKFNIDLK